jgi:hypothetical protein
MMPTPNEAGAGLPAPTIGATTAPPGITATDDAPARSSASRIGIVWVILGGMVLGVAVVLVALIPVIVPELGREPVPTGQEPRIAAGEAAAEAHADEQAAIETVERYFDAWRTGDCDTYLATTTEQFRTSFKLTDCEGFVAAARGSSGSVDSQILIIDDAETDGEGRVTVHLSELHNSRYDDDGKVTDARVSYERDYTFTVVALESGALIMGGTYG